MSCIVYRTNKKNGITYAYESVSYWDKEKKQPRSTRKYLGKVDPVTGEIIPKKKRPSGDDDSLSPSANAALKRAMNENEKLRAEMEDLHTQMETVKKDYALALDLIRSIEKSTADFSQKVSE